MAINLGDDAPGKVRPEMNVTPLVDVVLVLLIIFMVVTPLMSKQFWVNVPEMQKLEEQPPPDQRVPVVLAVAADGNLSINRSPVTRHELDERLRRIFAARQDDRTLFVQADDRAAFGRVVEAMDAARGAGAVTIAVLPEKEEDG
ncbi:MAG: biopolymer transporter ExbD [Deltaproteobacteria bacterium]|nr:biopolymer transporter ExbD [Deltaproteobacteria bacterium]